MADIRRPSTRVFVGEDAIHEMENAIVKYEMDTLGSFVKVKGKKLLLPVRSKFMSSKIFWQEHSCQELPLSYDGVPFCICGGQVLECCYGPDRHRAEKSRLAQLRKADHDYVGQSRQLIQNTKKMDCPAAIHVRSVVRFPSYRIEHNSDWARRKQVKQLHADLRDMKKDVPWEHCIYITLPAQCTHKYHITNEIGALSHNVDKIVIGKIHGLVADGVRSVAEMKRHIFSFSKANFPGSAATSNRFYPNNKCLRNHMYAALNMSQFSSEDQENLGQNIKKWKGENPDDNFYFVPSPRERTGEDAEDFIYVHQTSWQRRLLLMYGSEICLLDATYNICKCEVALYFICISTNVGYITVGCFLLPSETVEDITRGLTMLKQWNPLWTPSFFMTDYDRKEISAIETVFPGCFTFLCNFHREQSWDRWLKKTANGVAGNKKELLQLMRAIAHATDEVTFDAAVGTLKNCEQWKENERLRLWFEKQWLSASKRWVLYHRQILANVRVSTTNGLERQHQELKKNYLTQYTEGTLTSLLTTVVNNFLPDSIRRYQEKNVRSLESSRSYARNVPQFLKNRPRLFRENCTKRLSSAFCIPSSHITELPGNKFKVISEDNMNTYSIDLEGRLPSCSCPDWCKTHFPCKHMLCILLTVQGHGWDTLSEEFTQSPFVCIDEGIVHSSILQSHVASTSCQNVSSTPCASKPRNKPNIHRTCTVAGGSRCKMLASSIHGMLHLIRNNRDYESLYPDLLSLHEKVREMVPKEAGILLRPSRRGRKPTRIQHGLLKPRRRYKNSKKTARKNAVCAESSPAQVPHSRIRVVPMTYTLPLPDDLPMTKDDSTTIAATAFPPSPTLTLTPPPATVTSFPSSQGRKDMFTVLDVEGQITHPPPSQAVTSNSDTAESVLQNVLHNPPTDTPIVQIGPYCITDSSIHYLNSNLSDEVIDSCFHLMAMGNVCHIDCLNMTAIFDKDRSQDTTSYLPRLQLQSCDTVIGAVNEGGVHWVLMIIIPGAKRLVYMNPLGERPAKIKAYQKRWHMFLKERCRRGIEMDTIEPAGWQLEIVPHSKQVDSSSCGIHVIRFAEQYLCGQPEYVALTKKDIQMERRRIQLQLLSKAIPEQESLAHDVMPKSVGHNITKDDAPRKRRRKDQRKSSLFIYSMPKKRERHYCICREKDDGSQYWQCESCCEWLHPSCMGLDEKDEPSKYICSGCQLLHLPMETLQIIMKEVVLADGDVAYGRLALVCSTFRQISSSQPFRNDCHLSWLLSIRPPSYWSRNAELYHTFSIVACISCGNVYKEEGPGFCGGNGKRGEFRAFYDEVENPGFCSVLCANISGYTVCDNDDDYCM